MKPVPFARNIAYYIRALHYMFFDAYYAQNYAGIIGRSLAT